jgi:hypothetical protein
MGPTPGVRHSPRKGTPNRGFHTRARENFLSAHSCRRSRCWRTVAAHIRGSDGSIPSTATDATRSLAEALHAKDVAPSWSASWKFAASSLERWFSFCRCRTAVSTSVSRTDNTGSIPVTDTALARRGASGEAMTVSVNHASVRSLGANERWVRVPPPRLRRRRSISGRNSAAEYVALNHVGAGASPAARTF